MIYNYHKQKYSVFY